jgi:hypothetical protein
MSTENEQPVTNADWEAWKAEHGDDLKRIDELVARGHTRHCACRQVWGDGECSCELEKVYDPYWWMKIEAGVPFTTA